MLSYALQKYTKLLIIALFTQNIIKDYQHPTIAVFVWREEIRHIIAKMAALGQENALCI